MREKGIAKNALDFLYAIKNIDERGLSAIANEIEAQATERKNEIRKVITLVK